MNGSSTQRIVVQPSVKKPSHPGRLERRARPGRVQITERDREVFRSLAMHRLLTSEQLQRLHFPRAHSRRVRRRLRQLFDARLVDRIAVAAQPQLGVPPFVYTLTRDSAGLAGADLGRQVSVPPSHSTSLRFVAHHVGVCDFYVTLCEALRGTEWSVGEWCHEWELKIANDVGATRSERVFVTDPETHKERRLTVLPDAYFTLIGRSGAEHFFFEFDRSTHPLERWRARAMAFTAYARQGHFRRRFGGESFRVLVLTRPDFRGRSRCQNILETIELAVGATELFLATTTAELEPITMLDPIWRWAGRGERQQLLPGLASRRPAVRVVSRARPV